MRIRCRTSQSSLRRATKYLESLIHPAPAHQLSRIRPRKSPARRGSEDYCYALIPVAESLGIDLANRREGRTYVSAIDTVPTKLPPLIAAKPIATSNSPDLQRVDGRDPCRCQALSLAPALV